MKSFNRISAKPLVTAVLFALASPLAMASLPTVTPDQLPGKGVVVSGGSASFSVSGGSATLTVTAATAGAPVIIDWGASSSTLNSTGTAGFNIGSSASLGIANGSKAPSSVLNIDVSGQPSQILGVLSAASGPSVLVANENGVIVGSGATIDVPEGIALIAGSVTSNPSDTSAANIILSSSSVNSEYVSIAPGASFGSSLLLVGGDTVNLGTTATAVLAGYDFTVSTNDEIGNLTAVNTAASVNVTGTASPVATYDAGDMNIVTSGGDLTVSNVSPAPSTLSSPSIGAYVGGSLTNNGILNLTSTNTAPSIVLSPNSTFTNNGTLNVSASSLNISATNIDLGGVVNGPSSGSFSSATIGVGTSAGLVSVNTTIGATGPITIQGDAVDLLGGSYSGSQVSLLGGSGAVSGAMQGANIYTYDSYLSGTTTGSGAGSAINMSAGGPIYLNLTGDFLYAGDYWNLSSGKNVTFDSPNTLTTGQTVDITSPLVTYTGSWTTNYGAKIDFINNNTSSAQVVNVNGYVYNGGGSTIEFTGKGNSVFNMQGYIENGTSSGSQSLISGGMGTKASPTTTINVGGELTNYGSIDSYALNVTGEFNNYGSINTTLPISAQGPQAKYHGGVIHLASPKVVFYDSNETPSYVGVAPSVIIWEIPGVAQLVIPSAFYSLFGIS